MVGDEVELEVGEEVREVVVGGGGGGSGGRRCGGGSRKG